MRAKAVATILCFQIFLGAIPGTLGAKPSRYLLKSTYTFENRGETPYIIVNDDAEVPLFVNNDRQKATIINASHEILEEIHGVNGKPVGYLNLPSEIEAGGSLAFSVKYLIESGGIKRPIIDPMESKALRDIPERLVDTYTSETETFRLNDEIEGLALELMDGSTDVLEIVTDVLNWVITRITYRNFEVPRYPDETLESLQGDCDDQAILMISILRSLGIPAFLQIGVVFSESISSESSSWEGHLTFVQDGIGWHGWAMVYIPPWGWIPIDLTLTNAKGPLDRIKRAPEYSSNIVTAFNVSEHHYIAESRRSREKLVASEIYITIADVATVNANISFWNSYNIIGAFVIGGTILVGVFMFISKKRPYICISAYPHPC
ncbi:MAG: transglutaminase-like domain-containing protein [Candidatus Bathyarchaeota archaeon]|nr:transglutaminase-like domain-containing protein [Candidatus Bathyarchaeota archaeon]